ncbi:EcoRI family type II restriction endonuclease, partial [Escherichia coli]
MSNKKQSNRLTEQHKLSQGVIGIFGDYAKAHDLAVGEVSKLVKKALSNEYPQLSFRYRDSIKKTEINEALKKIDPDLGGTLFVSNSSIKPDGGIVEVKDDYGEWRV